VDVTVAVVCFGERARTLTPFAYLWVTAVNKWGARRWSGQASRRLDVILIAWPPPSSVVNPRRCRLD
jgi:hypothetical protein